MNNSHVLSNFFELADDAMIITDKGGQVLKFNASAVDLVEGLGQAIHIQELFSEDGATQVQAVLSRAEDKLTHRLTLQQPNLNNQTLWISWKLSFDVQTECVYWVGRNITQEKQKNVFLSILEEVTDTGVWELAEDGDVAHWSDKVHDIHETDSQSYTPNISEALAFYPPEAIPPLTQALKQQATTGESYNLVLPFVTSKNKSRMVNARGFVETESGRIVRRYGTFKDVTEQEQKKREKQKLEQRMSLAIELANIGVWEYDLSTDELFWDDKMFALYGVDESDFSGTIYDWENAVVEEDLADAKAAFSQAIESGELFVSQFRIRTPKGIIRHIKAAASCVYEDGDVVQILGVNLDQSVEVHQRQLLESEKDKANAATHSKSQFLAMMSHEIRTPLNGIIGGLQILQQHYLKPEGAFLAQRSMRSATSLLGIINDILDYSKIIEGKITVEPTEVDLPNLVNQLCDEQRYFCDTNNNTLSVDVGANVPQYVMLDPTRFRQVMTNILSNAIKFTKDGHISLSVDMKSEGRVNQFAFIVSDNGIGMSDAQVERLYEPFVQGDGTITRRFGGSGLGLSIVKKLVSLMHGSISVRSEFGQGTTFTLIFPFTTCQSVASEPTAVESVSPDWHGKTVIVAEDDELNQILIQYMLEETGANVTCVVDGEGLLEKVTAFTYDLILCDINMPGMGGVEACKTIRQQRIEVPMYAFTASVMSDDIKLYYEIGFNGVIAKPVIKQNLYSILMPVFDS